MAERQSAADLLHQQCWCWGRDVAAAGGENLLLAYGATRVRRDDGQTGGTMYRFRSDAGDTICLWGFGMFYGRGAWGLMFSRGRRGVRLTPYGWTPSQHLHAPAELPSLMRPRDAVARAVAGRLGLAACAWVAAYERWVVAHRGADYRRRTLHAWERTAVEPERMADAWQKLGRTWATIAPSPVAAFGRTTRKEQSWFTQ